MMESPKLRMVALLNRTEAVPTVVTLG